MQTRKRGLTVDNLLSVDIVTADGTARVASAGENPDLFWAVRGGGGNFGIVTSFEYRAYPIGPTVYLCAPFFPFDHSPKVFRAFRDLERSVPEEMGAALLFWSVPANRFFPAEHHGKPVVVPVFVYTGDPAAGETLLRPVRNWAKPLVDLSGPLPWTVLQSMFDPFVPKQAQRYYWKNLYINRDDDEVLDRLIEIAATTPSRYTYLVWQPLGGAMARVGDEETAFGPRKVGTMWEFEFDVGRSRRGREEHRLDAQGVGGPAALFEWRALHQLPRVRRGGRAIATGRRRQRQLRTACRGQGKVRSQEPVPAEPEHQAGGVLAPAARPPRANRRGSMAEIVAAVGVPHTPGHRPRERENRGGDLDGACRDPGDRTMATIVRFVMQKQLADQIHVSFHQRTSQSNLSFDIQSNVCR